MADLPKTILCGVPLLWVRPAIIIREVRFLDGVGWFLQYSQAHLPGLRLGEGWAIKHRWSPAVAFDQVMLI